MNLLLIDERDCVSSDKACVAGRRHEHMRDVLKVSCGDTLCAGLINGKIGTAEVVDLKDDEACVKFSFTEDPPPKIPVTVILALPRPPVFKRLLASLSAMGVGKIIVLQTARVEKSYWNSPVITPTQIRETLVLGLEQAKDTILPDVILKKKFRPFVEDELPEMIQDSCAFVAHPDEACIACPSNLNRPSVLAFGPEGGFVPFEMDLLKEIGFQSVHLGRRILRVETAVQAAVGRMISL